MARRPRIHYSGAIYHVMARGVDGREIFADDRDRARFLGEMRRIARETSAEVIAYCLMGNHFHLAIRVGAVPLAFIMQRLLGGYCAVFNHRHGRTGHLFQARYKAILCLDDYYLAGLIRYIHMNPVRAGLVSAPIDWPWSSCSCSSDNVEGPADFDPWPEAALKIDMTREVMDRIVSLEAIGFLIAVRTGIGTIDLRSSRRDRAIIAARRLFVREAVGTGYALVSAAKWLNLTRSTVSRYARENTATMGGLTP